MTSDMGTEELEREESSAEDEKTVPAEKRSFLMRHRGWFICGGGLAFLLFVAYGWMYMQGWKFSFTNVNYTFTPFSSTQTSTSGPMLTDPADNILPISWRTFHPLTVVYWLSDFGIGCAQSANIYMSPLNYLYMLPYDIAQVLISMVKVSVAFIGMALFIRQLGYSWRGAVISGTSYALCSVMVMWNGWQHSEVTMYAPILLLLLDKALSKLKVGYFLGAGLVIYLMLVAGMPTYAAYFLYLTGAYVLFYGCRCHWGEPKRLLAYFAGFAVAVVLGALMSFPYTISLLSTVGSNGYASSRSGQSFSRLALAHIKSLFFPYLPTSDNAHANECTLYAGVLAMISLPLTVVHFRRKKRAGFFAVTAIVTVLLVFTPALDMVFHHLPMINTSMKYRVLVILDLALSVLVGINLDEILSAKKLTYKDKWQIGAAAFAGLAVFAGLLYWVMPVIRSTRVEYPGDEYRITQVYVACIVAVVFFMVVITKLITARKGAAIACTVAMMASVCLDMGYFGSQYFPWIAQPSPAVPKPTDTIRYLQRNTTNNEKIVAKGGWTFFASSNMYYGLRDIDAHGFVFTNSDMKNYYLRISETAFSNSPTKPFFEHIENENLLKYMGVKFIEADSDNIGDGMPESDEAVFVGIPEKNSFKQEFTASDDDLSMLSFPVNVDGRKTGTLTIKMYGGGKELVASQTMNLTEIPASSIVQFTFPEIKNSRGKTYRLEISAYAPKSKSVSVVANKGNAYPGASGLSNGEKTGDLQLSCLYGSARKGADGLSVRQLDDYAPQVELIDDVQVKDTDKQVLNAMSRSFTKNRLYLSKESGAPANDEDFAKTALGDDENITNIDNQRSGNISFDVQTDRQRYVLVNEYNDGNWTAYVDGEKTDIYKGNYLFRAISVPAGKHHVELRYESKVLQISCMKGGFGVLLGGVLLLTRKRINRSLESLNGNESGSAK